LYNRFIASKILCSDVADSLRKLCQIFLKQEKLLTNGYCHALTETIKMKRVFITFLTLIFFSNYLFAQDNLLMEISGHVTNQERQQPLPDVSVQVKGTVAGTGRRSCQSNSREYQSRCGFALLSFVKSSSKSGMISCKGGSDKICNAR
jgi:hypothetical protein